jgi:hypothetical protein
MRDSTIGPIDLVAMIDGRPAPVGDNKEKRRAECCSTRRFSSPLNHWLADAAPVALRNPAGTGGSAAP